MLSFQLAKATGNLGKVAGFEQAERETDTAIAPTSHQQETTKKESETTPGRDKQAVFEPLMRFPADIGSRTMETMAVAEQALGLPSGVLIMLAHVAIDATEVTMINPGADQTNGTTHNRMLMNFHITLGPVLLFDALIFDLSDTKQSKFA
jgi:hypothetical protein